MTNTYLNLVNKVHALCSARKMVMAQAYLRLVLLEFLCQINVMLMKTYVNFETHEQHLP